MPTMPWGQSTTGIQALHRESRRQGADQHPVRSIPRISCLTSRRFPPTARSMLPASSARCRVAFYIKPRPGARQEGQDVLVVGESGTIDPTDIQARQKCLTSSRIFPGCSRPRMTSTTRSSTNSSASMIIYAKRIAGTRREDKSHGWQAWGGHLAHQGRRSRNPANKTRADVEGVIQALEGMEMKNSLATRRRQDHSAKKTTAASSTAT